MARLFDDASNEYLEIDQWAGWYTYAVSAWIKRDADVQATILSQVDKDVATSLQVFDIANNAGGNRVRLCTVDSGGETSAVTTSGITNNIWHHVLGILATSNGDRRVFLDGGSKGTDATLKTPGTVLNRTSIGRRGDSTPDNYMSGNIAEVAIWKLADWPGAIDVDKADNFEKIISSLAKGFSPLFFPLGLIAYWPLIREVNI